MQAFTLIRPSTATAITLLLACASCGRLGFDAQNSSADAGDTPTIDGTLESPDSSGNPDATPSAFSVMAQDARAVENGAPVTIVQDLAVDPAGNVYITGSFAGIDFADDWIVANGTRDGYVASFDSELSERWLQVFGTERASGGVRALWRGDTLYSQLFFQGTIDNASVGTIISQGQDDHLLLKMDTGGQVTDWAAFGSVGDDDLGRGLAVDANGAVFTGGTCSDAFDYGGGPLTGDGSRDPCFARLDENLDHVVSGRLVGPDDDTVRGTALFPNGDAMVIGYFTDTITIDSTVFTAVGGKDVFAMRLAPNGDVIWKYAYGGDGDDIPEHVAIDEVGYVYTAITSFSSSLDYDGQTVPLDTATGPDSLIVSTDDWAQFHWAVLLTGPGSEIVEDIAVLDDGSIAFAGGFQGPAQLAGHTIEAAGGGQDMLVGVLDAWGNPTWWRAFGSSGPDSFMAVDGYPGGGVAVTGFARGAVDLGTGTVGANDGKTYMLTARMGAQ